MSLPRYPKYKDSGVEWLGEIPTHWEVLPLFGVAVERNEPNRGMIENNLLSLSYGRIVQKDIDSNNGLLPESFETYQIVHPGDIVFRLTDLQNDKRSLRTAIVEELGIITSAYLAAIPLRIHPQFFHYILRAYDLTKVFYSMGGGLRQSMNFWDVKRLPILVPSPEEQLGIGTFLDAETGKIDALIKQIRRLIELLQEKRQSVISHAVTKGLNPSASMKYSGIEWMGKIPAHWVVKRLKYCGDALIGLTYDPSDVVDEGEGILVLRSSNVQNGRIVFDDNVYVNQEVPERLIVRRGDILICSRNGSRALIGKNAMIEEQAEGLTFGAFMTVFRSVQNPYLFWVLNSPLFEFQSSSFLTSTVNQLTVGNLRGFEIPLPPPDERVAITAFLEFACQRIDKLISSVVRATELLQERRTAIISAAVTGKIDVRGLESTEAA